MLNLLINSDTINPFHNVITASDLRNFMIKYYEKKYSNLTMDMQANADYMMKIADDKHISQKVNPRVFGKHFGFILTHSKTPFKLIDIISLGRGLVYKFNFTKLRKYMEQIRIYDVKTEKPQCKVYSPCYLSIVDEPFSDPQLMDRLYCDFFFYDFIRNKDDDNVFYDKWKQTPPGMVFISVLSLPSEMSMSLTDAEILDSKNLRINLDADEAFIKTSATKLFQRFINFLQKILELKDALNEDVSSALLQIRCWLNVLNFGADMERFLFASELGSKKRSNGKIIYHLAMEKIKQFLITKLDKQRDIQFKQLDIQGRTPDQEYEDFTDTDPSIDEKKDRYEIYKRDLKKRKWNLDMANWRKRHKYGKHNGEDCEKKEALRNWEQEDIEDRTNGINDQEKADVIKHLHSYHLAAQRKG
jgi:hypothetical protein